MKQDRDTPRYLCRGASIERVSCGCANVRRNVQLEANVERDTFPTGNVGSSRLTVIDRLPHALHGRKNRRERSTGIKRSGGHQPPPQTSTSAFTLSKVSTVSFSVAQTPGDGYLTVADCPAQRLALPQVSIRTFAWSRRLCWAV